MRDHCAKSVDNPQNDACAERGIVDILTSLAFADCGQSCKKGKGHQNRAPGF